MLVLNRDDGAAKMLSLNINIDGNNHWTVEECNPSDTVWEYARCEWTYRFPYQLILEGLVKYKS